MCIRDRGYGGQGQPRYGPREPAVQQGAARRTADQHDQPGPGGQRAGVQTEPPLVGEVRHPGPRGRRHEHLAEREQDDESGRRQQTRGAPRGHQGEPARNEQQPGAHGPARGEPLAHPAGDGQLGGHHQQRRQREEPGQRRLRTGHPLHFGGQRQVELVVGEQICAVRAAQGEEAPVAQQRADAAPDPDTWAPGDVLRQQPGVSGEDEHEDPGAAQAHRAVVDREQQRAEQRPDERPGLPGHREQREHPGP